MPYVITNGSTYIRYMPNNTPMTTPKKGQARVFQSEVRAQNSCVCLPNAYRKMGFYVAELSEANPTDEEPAKMADPETEVAIAVSDSPETELGFDEQLLDLDYIISVVSEFENLIIALKAAKPQIKELQSRMESEIVDVEHIAEFSNLSAPKAYKIYRQLHDSRVMRRRCKDSLEALRYIDDAGLGGMYQHKASKSVAGLQSRQYTPRVLTDLYEEICTPKK